MAKKFQYVLHPKCRKKDHVLTIINGEHIDLVGDGIETISPARRNRPEKPVKYRKAKEEDLKNFYELGLVTLPDGSEYSNQKIVIKVARELPSNGGSSTGE